MKSAVVSHSIDHQRLPPRAKNAVEQKKAAWSNLKRWVSSGSFLDQQATVIAFMAYDTTCHISRPHYGNSINVLATSPTKHLPISPYTERGDDKDRAWAWSSHTSRQPPLPRPRITGPPKPIEQPEEERSKVHILENYEGSPRPVPTSQNH